MSEKVTFSFGENWRDYLKTVTETEIEAAVDDIRLWLSDADIQGKAVLDAGSGSGIHSLSFHRLGAASICSFDLDPHSVMATKSLWEQAGRPDNWHVQQGSVLDRDFIRQLGNFDVVYSWGVLHHTGQMWHAIENAASLVKPGGVFFISIYAKGGRYEKDLRLKQAYNAASESGKQWMVRKFILKRMWKRARRFKNPLRWHGDSVRGMNPHHDLIDWLGGLPYEVASVDEIVQFGMRHGFALERIRVATEGACSVYVLRSVPELLARTATESTPEAA